MAYSNAEKQQRHRQRLREQGLVQVQGWVTPEQAEVIRRIMANQVAGASPKVPRSRSWEAQKRG